MKSTAKNLLIAFLITFFPLILLFAPLIINYNKTASNTKILGKDYSHLSRQEIINKLNQDFVLPDNLKISYQDKNFTISIASVSASINTDKVAATILYRRLDEGVVNYVKYFFNPKEFSLSINYDSPSLTKIIEDIASQVDKPFIPTELILKDKKISTNSGSVGLSVDQSKLQEQILNNLSFANFSEDISITVNSIGSIPDENQVNQTISRAQKLIGKSIILITPSDRVTINDQTLISWIDFNNGFQQDKISSYSQNTAQSFKHDPIDAVFKFENNKVLEFQTAKNGIAVDPDQLTQDIISAFTNLENSDKTNFEFTLSYQSIEPKIKNSDANDLGIKELIGSGTSTFKHSSPTRNINITKGSSIVNRLLVGPGDTFSFVKSLGEVTLEAGYAKAYIIRQGKTELDVGGGICQVSTTLFRAMLNAGLNITERKNHAYRVSYYEEDSKPGYDATVFIPSPDLKFINDTGHYVLIQSVLDMENRRLTYEIYGTSDGRKSEISNYRQWDSTPAPPDIWIDDPTLPAGKTVQDEHAIPGLKTAFDWTVKDKDGHIIHQKTFQSNFVPWAAVYRRGPQN
ncbi:MAG: VanW family protein [Candidatus Shapirobacteria bacterium]|nr:VanW family protein [Candidatus Shapirobacteria bacterium]